MMEQRTEIIKRLNVNRKQSLLLEQEVDGRVIRFRIRKPSMCDYEDGSVSVFAGAPATPTFGGEHLPMVELQSHNGADSAASQTAAQSPIGGAPGEVGGGGGETSSDSTRRPNLANLNNLRPDEANVRRMHTALTLNEAILKRSKSSKLVILNLPGVPKVSTPEAENNCK